MPRGARKRSDTGYYHITLRGNGRQNLFEEDEDRTAFMDAVRSSFTRCKISLIAWCLMGNHVHLIVDDPHDRMSEALQVATSVYAMYFNRRFGHTGHVFEGRYGSVPIHSDEQLLAAVRYVHDNPLKGMGIAPESYPWCSYSEYATGIRRYADVSTLLGMLGGIEGFTSFSKRRGSGGYRPAFRKYAREDEREAVARDVLEGFGCTASGVKELPRDARDRVLKALCDNGLSVGCVQRITGIGEWTIRNAAGRIKKR